MYTMYCGERFWILLGQYILYPWRREWFNKAQKHVGFPMPSIEQLCEISSLLNMWFWGASLNIYMLMNVNHLEANCGCPCGFKMLYVFKKKKRSCNKCFLYVLGHCWFGCPQRSKGTNTMSHIPGVCRTSHMALLCTEVKGLCLGHFFFFWGTGLL